MTNLNRIILENDFNINFHSKYKENRAKIEEIQEHIISNKDDFETISYLYFNFKNGVYKKIINDKYIEYSFEKILKDMLEEHIKEHYYNVLKTFKEEEQNSIFLYNYFLDYDYELIFDSSKNRYYFKNISEDFQLSEIFFKEILKLVRNI